MGILIRRDTEEIRGWLETRLSQGPVRSSVIHKERVERGFGRNITYKVAEELGITAERAAENKPDTWWRLP